MVYYTPFSFGYMRKMLGNLVTSREHFWFGCEGNGKPLPPPPPSLVDTVTVYFNNLLGFFFSNRLYLLPFNVQKGPIES